MITFTNQIVLLFSKERLLSRIKSYCYFQKNGDSLSLPTYDAHGMNHTHPFRTHHSWGIWQASIFSLCPSYGVDQYVHDSHLLSVRHKSSAHTTHLQFTRHKSSTHTTHLPFIWYESCEYIIPDRDSCGIYQIEISPTRDTYKKCDSYMFCNPHPFYTI